MKFKVGDKVRVSIASASRLPTQLSYTGQTGTVVSVTNVVNVAFHTGGSSYVVNVAFHTGGSSYFFAHELELVKPDLEQELVAAAKKLARGAEEIAVLNALLANLGIDERVGDPHVGRTVLAFAATTHLFYKSSTSNWHYVSIIFDKELLGGYDKVLEKVRNLGGKESDLVVLK
jgi:hypothetical protein